MSESVVPRHLAHRWALTSILVMATLLYVWKFDNFQVGVYMDDAEYVVLAASIVDGPRYGIISAPDGVGATRYPFGWPLLLAPIYVLTGGNLQALKAVALAATLINIALIALTWQWLGLGHAKVGMVTAALYALLPVTVGHAGMVMSEAAFLTAVLVCLGLSARLGRIAHTDNLLPLALGIAWMFTAYIRTIGVTIVVASLVFLLWRRRWRATAYAWLTLTASMWLVVNLPSITTADVFDVRVYQAQAGILGSGTAATTAMLARAWEGISLYGTTHVRDTLIPFVGGPSVRILLTKMGIGWTPDAVGMTVSAFVTIGYLITLHRQFHPSHIAVPLYLAVIAIWPWRDGRFLYGVAPYLVAYIVLAGAALLTWATRALPVGAPVAYRTGGALLVLWLIVLGARSALLDRSLAHTPDLRVGTAWIKENVPLDAVVVAEQPLALYLYTERSTMGLHDIADLTKRSCLQPTYILIAPRLEWRHDRQMEISPSSIALREALENTQGRATVVFTDLAAQVQVFRLSCNVSSSSTQRRYLTPDSV